MHGAHRPRVLLTITLGDLGGAQSYVADLLEGLHRDFDLFAAASRRGVVSDAAERAGVPYTELRWMRRDVGWRDVFALVELVRLMRRIEPEIVHASSSKAGFIARIAAVLGRVPVRLFTVHGWSFRPHTGTLRMAWLGLERLARPLTTKMVFPAQSTRAEGIETGACTPEQAVLIPYSVRPQPERARPARQPPRIISVARLTPQKDVTSLVRALGLLPSGTFHALLVGDGEDRPAIEAEIDAVGIRDSVELLGDRNDVPDLLASADVFVLATWWEALPIAILEAMAAGLPVVASDVDGVGEMVVDGETGILVPPGEPEPLAAALAHLIEDKGARDTIGEAARRRVIADFGPERFLRAHRELYNREHERARGDTGLVESPPDRPPLPRRALNALERGGPKYMLTVAGRYVRLRARATRAALEERRFDRRLGVDTRGLLYHTGAEAGAYHYQGVSLRWLETSLTLLPEDARECCFIDIGCGKGKALLIAGEAGFRHLVGVDLSAELVEIARANLTSYARRRTELTFEVLDEDATEYPFPPEPTVLFLYNPFGEPVMSSVLANLEKSIREHPRRFYVIYMNPQLEDLFEAAPFLARIGSDAHSIVYEARG